MHFFFPSDFTGSVKKVPVKNWQKAAKPCLYLSVYYFSIMAKKTVRRSSGSKPKAKPSLEFHFLKTQSYRTYHVDGAFGGLTPRGGIYIEFYVERLPTPNLLRQEMNEDGTLGNILATESKHGVIREIECGVALDLTTAEALQEWLGNRITELRGLRDEGKIGQIPTKRVQR
ncbi:MAG: hypothetical protein ABI444_08165 [Candidatus Kapaibacterium sp.]|jgi:hypothetical protein